LGCAVTHLLISASIHTLLHNICIVKNPTHLDLNDPLLCLLYLQSIATGCFTEYAKAICQDPKAQNMMVGL